MSKKQPKILKLYLSYHFNRIFCLILFFILISWIGILLLNANIPFKLEEYIKYVDSFHEYYYQQSYYFLTLIDGVIVAYLVGVDINTEGKFDPLFVSFTSRSKIIIIRIASNLILLFLIVFYQVVLLNVIGTFVFPNFKYDINELLLIPYSLIPLVALLLIGELIGLFVKSNFISVLIFVFHLIFTIGMQNQEFYKLGIILIPQTKFINIISPVLEGNLIIYFCFITVLLMIITLIYQRKDLKSVN